MLIYSFFPILRLPLFIPRTRSPSSSSAGRDDEHSHSLLPFQAPRRSSSFPRHGRSSPSLPSLPCPWPARRGVKQPIGSAPACRAHGSLWRRPARMAARRDPRPGRHGHCRRVSASLTERAGNKSTRQGGGRETARPVAKRYHIITSKVPPEEQAALQKFEAFGEEFVSATVPVPC